MVKWLCFLLLLAAIALTEPWQYLPPEWDPWEPLALEHEMTLVTRWKLAQLKGDKEKCRSVLASAPSGWLDHLPLEDYTPVEGCPLTNVVRLKSSSVSFSAPFTAACPLVVAWVMFEQQRLQPLARSHFGEPLTRVDHYGAFSCRNIYAREKGRLSEHATASALDVAAFRLADDTRISVREDWNSTDHPARKAFLRDTLKAACKYFGTVLGPEYNQQHENHFHFDTSNFGVCR